MICGRTGVRTTAWSTEENAAGPWKEVPRLPTPGTCPQVHCPSTFPLRVAPHCLQRLCSLLSLSHITQLPLPLGGVVGISPSGILAFFTHGPNDAVPAQGSGQALGGTHGAPPLTAHSHLCSKPDGPFQRPWVQLHFPFSLPFLEAKLQHGAPEGQRDVSGHPVRVVAFA